jgi:L-alanine-DL-glutamate epimerase-like enolase superfamily enzyme
VASFSFDRLLRRQCVTEDGIYGLGDATLNGRELSVASYLSDHVAPLLIGRDARRMEDTWQYLYKGAYSGAMRTDLSPVCLAAAPHFDISVHNFGIQEYMRHTKRPTMFSRARTRSPMEHSTLATGLGSASTSTRSWRKSTLTNALTFP